jgi:hypothetical protein
VSFSLGEPERFSGFRAAEADAFERGEAGGQGQRDEDGEDGEEAGMSEAIEESQSSP